MRNKRSKSEDSKKGNIKSLKAIFAYIKPYKYHFMAMCVALIFTSVSVLALGKGVSYLVDEGFRKNDPDLLDNALITLFAVTILLAFATYARYFLITYIGEKVVADIRRDVFNRILLLSPTYFENMRTGDILSRLTTDITILQMVVGSSLSVALRNSLLLTGGLVLLVLTSPKLTIYVILLVPIVIIPIMTLGKKVRILSRKSQEKIGNLSTYIEESVSGLRTIQSYVREDIEKGLFNNKLDDVLEASYNRIKLRALLTALVIMIVFSAIGFVLWSGGHDVISGEMTPGKLSSFIFYSIVVAGATGAISEVIGDLQRAAGATERLLEIMAEEPEIKNPIKPKKIEKLQSYDISFNIKSFSYSSSSSNILSDFKIDIKEGETIALVGVSGAGKTTIINLLLRFYDSYNGTITIGGEDIRNFDINDLRSIFGLVPQSPTIFSSTIRENISYGNIDSSDEEIMNAANLAMAHDFISALSDGLDSHLGEKGVRLSGGQQQRISIARAILKNPSILLLDEATSALDAENEQLVHKALENLMKDRTTIVIAHRLSTIKKADRIIVIDDGRVHAIGTHEELMKENGLYSKLANMQFME